MAHGRTTDAQPTPEELLGLIRRSHLDHDSRLATANAIRGVEVWLVGVDRDGLGARLSERLRVCGGSLVSCPDGGARLAIPTPLATLGDLDEAAQHGVTVITERDLDALVDVYAFVHGVVEIRAAARRAREEVARATAAASVCADLPRVSSGFHTGSRRPHADRERMRLNEQELELQEHAKQVRGTTRSGAFREHRLSSS